MSDDVRDFLIDLASNADRQARFTANPGDELARSTLSAEERGVMMTGDSSRVRRLMTASDNGAPIKSAPMMDTPIKSARKRKTSRKKTGGKKKGGRKKGGKKAGRKK
jgi:hypothetical protein